MNEFHKKLIDEFRKTIDHSSHECEGGLLEGKYLDSRCPLINLCLICLEMWEEDDYVEYDGFCFTRFTQVRKSYTTGICEYCMAHIWRGLGLKDKLREIKQRQEQLDSMIKAYAQGVQNVYNEFVKIKELILPVQPPTA